VARAPFRAGGRRLPEAGGRRAVPERDGDVREDEDELLNLLPDDRGFAPEPEAAGVLRDRGGEDARVAMEVRLRDQRSIAAAHTPTATSTATPRRREVGAA
jgi:hypothetical protein